MQCRQSRYLTSKQRRGSAKKVHSAAENLSIVVKQQSQIIALSLINAHKQCRQ